MTRLSHRLSEWLAAHRPYGRRPAMLRLTDQTRPASPTASGSSTAGWHTVEVMLNVAVGPRGEFVNFAGYLPGHELAWASYPDAGPLSLTLETRTPVIAADAAFVFGNGYAVDAEGRHWPDEVRSVSVGDILRVTDPCGAVLYLAVGSCGFDQVDAPAADRIRPLSGSSAASR